MRFVLYSHYHEASKLCDVIGIIHQGKILESGSLAQLQERYQMKELDDIFVKIVEEKK